MPERIQMSRQHPWRAAHPDAVIVDRRSPFGNPWTFGRVPLDCQGLQGERWAVWDAWMHNDQSRYIGKYATAAEARAAAIRAYVDLLRRDRWRTEMVRADLAGKSVACWCPLDAECHGDVILRVASGGQP